MQKITTFLWFNDNAEAAIKFYTGIFKPSKKVTVTRCGKSGPGAEGSVLTIKFQLMGQEFVALNGGPHFKFTQAISLVVNCDSQEEVDQLWVKLSEGGAPGQCGWLKDKYGLSWQIVPRILIELMQDPDPKKSGRVMAAMMQMTKIDIARLMQAHQKA